MLSYFNIFYIVKKPLTSLHCLAMSYISFPSSKQIFSYLEDDAAIRGIVKEGGVTKVVAELFGDKTYHSIVIIPKLRSHLRSRRMDCKKKYCFVSSDDITVLAHALWAIGIHYTKVGFRG